MSDRAKAKMHRILIVDDHPLLREGLKRILDQQQDLEVIGEADTVESALREVNRNTPDLVLVDLTLREGLSGIDLIKALRTRFPNMLILVHSMHEEQFYAERAVRAGARGYISKSESAARLLEAVRTVLNGGLFLSQELIQRVMASYFGSRHEENRSPVGQLSDRELQTFQLIGKGLATGEIARRLGIGRSTVESHRARIKDKLGLKSGAALTRAAVHWVHFGESLAGFSAAASNF